MRRRERTFAAKMDEVFNDYLIKTIMSINGMTDDELREALSHQYPAVREHARNEAASRWFDSLMPKDDQ
jgi:hypothetical protein